VSPNPYGSIPEQLERHFRAWEIRGRGWTLYPCPVLLEPPFRPFEGHFVFSAPPQDTGRRTTFLSGFFGAPPKPPEILPTLADLEEDEPLPEVFEEDRTLSELQILLPEDYTPKRDQVDQLLSTLGGLSEPISFELVGDGSLIRLYLACFEEDRARVEHLLEALHPEAVLIPRENALQETWETAAGEDQLVVDFGLGSDFMRPLQGFRAFGGDPLSAVVAALSVLQPGETAIFQVLFQRAHFPWAESIQRAAYAEDGKPFFLLGPEGVAQAKAKTSRPLYACLLRLAARTRSRSRTLDTLRAVSSTLSQFTLPLSNELIPLENVGFGEREHEACLLRRSSQRPGMLLNSDELAALVHLPEATVRSPKFERQSTRTKAAPSITEGHTLILGENSHAGITRTVTLPADLRMRHSYVIGGSGTGKSTLLLNLILQDIEHGDGIAVLDPHGDLIDQILGRIPAHRMQDVVVFDPADEGFPIGFNILSAHSELERMLLSSDLVAVFRRLSTSWGDQMNSVLGNAILAFLESREGGTLLDLRRFLVDADFRTGFLKTVQDEEVVFYWEREFSLLRGNPQAPLLTRLDTFLRPKLIRNMVGQQESRLDFSAIMNGRQIFLAKLSQGAIGKENSYLLGALLVSKFQQMALARQELEASARADFFFYLDEFQYFITPSMTDLLSGVRKYRMGLTLAHQDLEQLGAGGAELLSSVLANAATRIVFRVGDQDARRLESGFSFFEAADLLRLGVGEAIARVDRADFDFNLRTRPLPEADEEDARFRREEIITQSRARYGTAKEAVTGVRASSQHEPPADETLPQGASSPPPLPAPAPAASEAVPPATVQEVRAGRKKTVAPPSAPSPGRGGKQHKYLQSLIKRFGEDRGYRVTIEKQILDGTGFVDVALERDDFKLAVEISVTTGIEHELQNVLKCLAAGFDLVVLVVSEKKALGKARTEVAAAVLEQDAARVRVLSPDELVGLLDGLEADRKSTEQTVAGYKVKVKYTPTEGDEAQQKRQSIGDVIGKALKRMRRSDEKS
jgi:hypothetical protein